MSTAPFVELRFNPTDLRPRDLPSAGAFLGSPADAIEASLAVARIAMVKQMREELRGVAEPTQAQILRISDLAWQAVFWRYRKVSAPVMADAYIRAYRAANAGDVPMSVIYDLADKHAEKVGDYFHASSRAALAEGFNTLINRRLPARAATDRVLDAYGLTSRQMRGYTAAKQFDTPVSDVLPRRLKAKARAYIDRAFTTRIRKLSTQEEHNIDQQAQQFAWMWLQDKGRLSEKAMKVWITAKDERVCEICGPLHGKRVGVNEQFKTAHGEFWTPGLHPNCRCVVRLLEMKFSKALVGTALADFNEEHPRAEDGRFGVKARTRVPTVEELERITAVDRTFDPVLDTQFAEAIQTVMDPQPQARRALTQRTVYPTVRQAPVVAPVEAPQEAPRAVAVSARPRFSAVARAKATTKTKTKKSNLVYLPASQETLDALQQGQFRLTQGQVWRDRAQASKDSAAYMKRVVLRETQEIKRVHKGRFKDPSTGMRYQLTNEQVGEVVDWYARSAPYAHEQGPANAPEPPELRIQALNAQGEPLLNARGRPARNVLSADVVGRELGLEHQDFDPVIIAVDRRYIGQLTPTEEEEYVTEYTRAEALFEPVGDPEFTQDEYNSMILEVQPFGGSDPSVEETVARLKRLRGD